MVPADSEESYLTVAEVAATLKLNQQTVRNWIDQGSLPALRVGRLQELGWAATFLASPFARFISGHTLVVDGANWQRRTLTNAAVITVRDQMGRGPFDPAAGR